MTEGFEVLVQLVMAAITTSPWPRSCLAPATARRRPPSRALPKLPTSSAAKASAAPESGTRSCGRLGPARLGSTLRMSSSRLALNHGSGLRALRHSPWALA